MKFWVGVEANFVGTDAAGCEWIFDASVSSSRPGLERTDTLWKALGKAAILHTQYPDPERPCRYVLLTTDMPKAGTAGHKALKAAQTSGLVWMRSGSTSPRPWPSASPLASGTRSMVGHRRGSLTASAG